ncbi:MAG: hypothetical protein ABL882_09840 [Sphingopyxis sp.]
MTTARGPGMSHDIKREARRRLIAGFAGVAAMVLLVVLAGWLTGTARHEAEIAKAQAQAAGVPNPGESGAQDSPVANLGVPPSLDSADKSTVPSAAAPIPQTKGGGMVVPDLQPDPQIEAPKARR